MIYDGKQDVVEYINSCQWGQVPRFPGTVKQYDILWDAELLVPEISIVRVFEKGPTGSDRIYFVLNRSQVEGAGFQRGSLRSPKGIHSIEEVLETEDSEFEVENFDLEKLSKNK